MKLTYVPVKIARDTTLLVTSPVDASLRAQTAGWLLRRVGGGDHVAFVTWNGDEPQLGTVSGGLDVNGAMALCAWLALQNNLPMGEAWSFPLAMPDGPAPLPCSVTSVNTCCLVTVTMPAAEEAAVTVPESGVTLPVVRFPGVSHVIAPVGVISRDGTPDLLKRWSRTLPDPVAGVLFWDEESLSFEPLIYDRISGDAVWRKSCGSAAAAVGAYLAGRAGKVVSLKQPGGNMAVTLNGTLTLTTAAEVGRGKSVDLVF